ncbi:uncharacterized protein LOC129974318 isoform X2 [Argiope bruennichi]|nr:uncharacterized protein LOC129974318 isoform X2 [Argiope bruennichi]
MDQIPNSLLETSSFNQSELIISFNQSELIDRSYQSELIDLSEVGQYHKLLGDIVKKFESKDSKPKSCSTPDTTRKSTSFSSTNTTPIRKISQTSTQHNSGILDRNEANNQSSSGVVIQNTNEEIAECINFVCVLIFGLIGFGVFLVLLEFVPKSNVTAALSVIGACLLLVLIFSFMSTLTRNRTPLNRR